MAKTRMNNAHRNVLRTFANKKIDEVVDRDDQKKLYKKLVAAANKAIRKKYPEKDMEVLEKYGLSQDDKCLKFQFPSGRVDGFTFNANFDLSELEDEYDEKVQETKIKQPVLLKVPYSRSCYHSPLRDVVFVMDEEFEKNLDAYKLTKENNDKIIRTKKNDCETLITFAKYVEDVLEVIKVPDDVRDRLVAKSTALVALTPDIISRIQKDFNA